VIADRAPRGVPVRAWLCWVARTDELASNREHGPEDSAGPARSIDAGGHAGCRDKHLQDQSLYSLGNMPRRKTATKFTLAIGRRLRAIREEKGLTLARVGEGSEDDGNLKGHVSNIEHGRVNLTLLMLKKIADNIEIELPYLTTLPQESNRQALIERTRFMTDEEVDVLLAKLGPVPVYKPPPVRRTRHRATGKKPKKM
jgi:transcriptional regulator with XRE-family HTH domain